MNKNVNSKINAVRESAKKAALEYNSKWEVTSDPNELTTISMIPINKLSIGRYQKELNIDRVKKIVQEFDIHRMRPIEVSLRDGEFWVFDGQHRANAYYLLGIKNIPCVIHKGLTYQDEAYLFAKQQENVGSVNCNHKWVALVEANDPETMDIIKTCKMYGFSVLQHNNKGNNIKCVGTLRKLYKEFPATKLGAILNTIKGAWEYMEKSTDVSIIAGMAMLVRTYPELNFFRLQEALSRTTPKMLLRDMEDKHHSVRGESRRAAYQMVDLYNKGLKGRTRLSADRLD